MNTAIATAAISAGAGLLGVATGAWITGRQQERKRKYERRREKLEGFYSPLLGMRSWILAKSELRLKLNSAANVAWQRLVSDVRDDPETLQKLSRDRAADFKQIIQENNRQLAAEILPQYREMVQLFRDRMALAEPSTIEHFGALVEFVELWDRWLGGTLPPEVVEVLEHGEERLQPFYNDLETQFRNLRRGLFERAHAF